MEKNMSNNTKTAFDLDSFRNDITNNEKFETFKTKYGFKTRQELDLQLLKLMRLDSKFYEYKPDPVLRGGDVYISKDGFLKTAARVVEGYKKFLNLDQIEFDGYEFKEDGILLKVKVS